MLTRVRLKFVTRLLCLATTVATFAAILVMMGHEAHAFIPVCNCNNSGQCDQGALCATDCKGTLRGVCSVP
jgi:hypothetical protein